MTNNVAEGWVARTQSGSRRDIQPSSGVACHQALQDGDVLRSSVTLDSLRLCACAVLFIACAAHAELVCDGVLGNSGEQGGTLVRFGRGQKAAGMGVVCDRFGSLWDRGGSGVLNRYALDGRVLAQYKIPEGGGGNDLLTSSGDLLIMLVGNRVLTLPIDAPAGTEVKPLKVEAQLISFGSKDGQVAYFAKGKLGLLNPMSGEVKELCAVKDAHAIELGPDGAIYVSANGKVQKYVDGQPAGDGWPRGTPGERIQYLDGYFYGSAWHGTLRRFTAALQPDPGVVLGGSSGSFIGHLDQNSELSNSRGLAKVRDNLFAASGIAGVLHLLEWQPDKKQFQIIRRIGAAPNCNSLGLDKSGRIWWQVGAWKWNDRPDAPLEQGINSGDEIGPGVMLDNDRLVAPGRMWGKPTFFVGALHDELKTYRIDKDCTMPKNITGTAVYKSSGKSILLAIDKSGSGQSFLIGEDGTFQKELPPVTLNAATPVKEWTTLAMKNETTLLAAGDGAVIELSPDGKDWKETKRWSSWADGQKFGARISISSDAGRLWVSDTERHRVIVFDLQSGQKLAQFGTEDKAGTDLQSLAFPQLLIARGDRAVVHDGSNQRFVKLVLK
ncbi:MAG TPA: hypothetical protein VEK08_04480 [Planctomycetota bacterium]|nr:hypothetical protein [Planctomycetota bacterium]